VTEAFSAFKLKFRRGKITEDQYIKYVKNFIHDVIGANLQIDEVPILTPLVFREAERLIQRHKIDFIDCFQIVTILHGQFRFLCLDSKSILITADQALAKAARAEGARVWEVTTEPAPV
jgi:predicted nucleic acid-binding protein